jgi:glycogen(starch) synthase
MNLLFLNEYASPNLVSGAEYSSEALAQALISVGQNRVVILSPQLSASKKRFKKRGVLYQKFPFLKKVKPGQTLTPAWFNNPFFWFYSAVYIYRALKQYQIDLIHVHGKYILPAAIIAGRLSRTPVVVTVRDFKFLCPLALCYTYQRSQCSLGYYLKHEIPEYRQRYQPVSIIKLVLAKLWQFRLKCFLRRADQVISVSPQLQRLYQQAGIKKLTAIYNLPPQAIKLKKALSRTRAKTVLSVGKLSYGKGSDTLLRVASKMPQYKFILAGAKNVSLKQHFPRNVHYLGQLPHSQALKLYAQADVFVILSRWPEPLSRAGLEALAAGLPIIASNRGANPELIRDNGYIVDPDNENQVKLALTKILTGSKLKLMAQNSRRLLVTRFNRTKIIKAHLNLYHQLCSKT